MKRRRQSTEVSVVTCTRQGKRPYQEDRSIIWNRGSIFVFGVFDGHGGKHVSEVLPSWFEALGEHISQEMFKEPPKFKRFLQDAVVFIDEKLLDLLGNKAVRAGSTASLGFLEAHSGIFYSLNLGDSRGVFVQVDRDHPVKKTSTLKATIDHKPSSAKEKKRIYAAGGTVETKNAQSEVARVAGTLAISRVFGDWELKSPLNGAKGHWAGNNADVVGPLLLNDPKKIYYIMFGSDGIFDVMKNGELQDGVLRVAQGKKTLQEECDSLVLGAIGKWNKLPRGVGDNVTLVMAEITAP